MPRRFGICAFSLKTNNFSGGKMKLKLLIVLSLAALLLLGGCRGDSNTNTANANRANMNTNMATPVTRTNEAATTDPTLKPKIEAALKAKGFTEVTVDTTTTPATLRGSYPKDRLPELMATAMEANGGKPVQNQATGK
jgi:ABC-type glycerol-3-phosphate transport system substrate-binding protein